jgi:hypothetical protein
VIPAGYSQRPNPNEQELLKALPLIYQLFFPDGKEILRPARTATKGVMISA